MEPTALDRLLGDVAAAASVAASCGFLVMCAIGLLGAVSRRRLPRLSTWCDRVTPARVRRLAALALGVSLATPMFGSLACATPPHPARSSPTMTSAQRCVPDPPRLAGLPLPDLPATAAAPRRNAERDPRTPETRAVIVRRGDTLWALAAGQLGSRASNADVLALTYRIYRRNRAAIGADPDLIVPGTTLRLPEGSR